MNNSSQPQHILPSFKGNRDRLLIIFIGVVGMILNLLVCRIILWKQKRNQPLDRLILNLAITDLINAVTLLDIISLKYLLLVVRQYNIHWL